MRNGQNNNKRMRSRPNNNNHNNGRRGQNPMTRVFESNGPDIKIRGTASHVAEKYVQLARDARSSGDPVAAENYYQHAEHYYRLIAAAQEQFRQNQPQQPRTEAEPNDEAGDEAAENFANFGAEPGVVSQQPYPIREAQPAMPREQPQPREQRQPRETHRQPRESRAQPQPAQTDDGGAVDRLPSFITGSAQQPQPASNGFEANAPQERFTHRRRRRAPTPRGEVQAQAEPAAPPPSDSAAAPQSDLGHGSD